MARLEVIPGGRAAERGPPAPVAPAAGLLEDLYRRHAAAVLARCRWLLRDPEAARDATQDVFVAALRALPEFRAAASPVTWLTRIATNHCLNLRRNAARRGDDAAVPDLELADHASPDALPSRAIAQQLLARFDETTQTVAVGVLVDGLEHEEVAEVLGISRRTVARKLERFLDAARAHLSRS